MNLSLLTSRPLTPHDFQHTRLLPQGNELNDIPQTAGGEKLLCHTSAPGRSDGARQSGRSTFFCMACSGVLAPRNRIDWLEAHPKENMYAGWAAALLAAFCLAASRRQ